MIWLHYYGRSRLLAFWRDCTIYRDESGDVIASLAGHWKGMILNALIVIQSVDNRVVGLDFRQPLEIAHFHLGDLGFDLVGPLLQLFADVLFTVRLILFHLV